MPASPEAHAAALTLADHRALRAQALRLCRRADEADDLVQETLLAGVLAGRHDMPWLSGVLRRQAAMAARSGVRRRRREALAAMPAENVLEPPNSHEAARMSRPPAWPWSRSCAAPHWASTNDAPLTASFVPGITVPGATLETARPSSPGSGPSDVPQPERTLTASIGTSANAALLITGSRG